MQSLKIRNYLYFLKNILERGKTNKLWEMNAREHIEKTESVVKKIFNFFDIIIIG